ncbi:MAG: hypothetical protein P4M08_06595 [Oligoflexia bacterium]|nr:hypothetical protein [Oligoflexia bacterium]
MSATHDKSQRTTFVYSNLYQLYRKGKQAAQQAGEVESSRPDSFHVLKAGDLKAESLVKIESFSPPEFLGKRVEAAREPALAPGLRVEIARPGLAPAVAPSVAQATLVQNAALSSLKENVKALQDLHSRLRFMLKELEELAKE